MSRSTSTGSRSAGPSIHPLTVLAAMAGGFSVFTAAVLATLDVTVTAVLAVVLPSGTVAALAVAGLYGSLRD